jgi:phytoene dehydrogenase-like protein
MIVIIGAGVAGLTCAKYLKDKGVDALVLEAADAVGGRVRTDLVDGFLLDRGFQVLLTAYPEAKKLLDYEALKPQRLPSGARVRRGDDFFVMPNPLKDIWTAPQALFSPVGGLLDKIKVLQLNLETGDASEPGGTNAKTEKSTFEFLKHYGFSEKIIERFFVPFFRGVFLERNLATKADFFKFLYHQFAKGDVVLPADGMQMIPEQIAARLAPGQIRLGAPVKKISGATVYLESGESIEAERIVVATDAPRAAKLLGTPPQTEFNSTVCLYFSSGAPLEINGEPYLIINSNAGELIDHLLVVSDVAPTYAPAGKTLISVNIVGEKDLPDDVVQEKVRAELAKWFGGRHVWRHLKTYKIADALPEYTENSSAVLDLKINERLFRCGDYAAYPSLNAAMKTGREVAEMLS